MNNSVEFAMDFLNILAVMTLQDNKGGSPIGYAIARMFLVDWGISVEEADTVNKMFMEKARNNSLDTMDVVQKRIMKRIGDNNGAKKRLLRQLASIACIDGQITEEEISFFKHWAELFDLKPSEAREILVSGEDLALALNFVGSTYISETS